MTKHLDLKGKPCPTPVVETKKALDEIEEGIVVVEVDSEVSKNNVERFAKKYGCNVDIEKKENVFILTITKGFTCKIPQKDDNKKDKYLLYVNKNGMGVGDAKLEKILMKSFFKTLIDNKEKPDVIIFVNSGVFLTVDGSEIIDELKILNEKFNVEILVCGTCLDFYNLKEKIKVGTISNMFDIQNALIEAKKIICP